MTPVVRAALLGPVLLAAACGGEKDPNWLTYPGVAGHARYFQLLGTPHDPYQPTAVQSCAGCHSSGTFTTFSCTGCHDQTQCDAIHLTNVAGYTWASTACYGCHKDGLGITPQDHVVKYFPIGDGTSHPAVCTACHTDLLDRRNVAKLACADCHRAAGVDARHAAVAGYSAATSSPDCVRCHADGQVNRIADHQATFPLLVGPAVSGSPRHVPDCAMCHSAYRSDRAWGADFTTFDCLGCHSDRTGLATTHAAVATYAYASPSCLGCHPQGRGHADLFPIGTGETHAGIACTACHTDLANPRVTANFACASCHAADQGAHTAPPSGVTILKVHTSERSFTTLAWTSPNCLRCHASSQVDAIADHPVTQNTRLTAEHKDNGCLSCHTALRADKPYAANFSSATGCNICH